MGPEKYDLEEGVGEGGRGGTSLGKILEQMWGGTNFSGRRATL